MKSHNPHRRQPKQVVSSMAEQLVNRDSSGVGSAQVKDRCKNTMSKMRTHCVDGTRVRGAATRHTRLEIKPGGDVGWHLKAVVRMLALHILWGTQAVFHLVDPLQGMYTSQ